MNYHSENPLKLYWVNHSGQRTPIFDINYGEQKTQCLDSFIGHSFELVDSNTEELVKQHTVEFSSIISVGESPPYSGMRPDYTNEIYNTHRSEWRRHDRISR